MNPRRATAEHEAAHIMAARHFGFGIQSAWVNADGSGMTVLTTVAETAEDVFKAAVIASAGAAWDHYRGRSLESSDHDREAVSRYQQKFVELEGRPMMDPFKGATGLVMQLIDGRALDALATALETGRSLTGEEIDGIVRAAVNPDPCERARAWLRADEERRAAEYEAQPAVKWLRQQGLLDAPRPAPG